MLSRRLLLLALVIGSALTAACDTRSTAPETPLPTQQSQAVVQYSAEQFFGTTSYTGNDINHDGSAMLVSSDETGVFNLYKVSIDGKNWQALTQSTTDAIFPISWFPQDDRLLYSADQGGNELTHIYVREVDGRIKDLTPGDKLKAYVLGWHNDHSFYIATNERDARYFDLYQYQSTDYSRQLVFTNNDGYSLAAISKNGVTLPWLKREITPTTTCF